MRKLSLFAMVCIAMVLVGTVWAQQPAEVQATKESRERRVKVALALSSDASCGQCRTDEDQARKEAEKDHKPVVLFVGGCTEQDAIVVESGGIAVAVPKYDRDERPATEPRIVILEPKSGGGFQFVTLPVNAKPQEIRDRVRAATAVPKAVQTIYSLPNYCPTCRYR